MVNLFFYLSDEEKARGLVSGLLEKKLVAHASITAGTETLFNNERQMVTRNECTVTAQTKAVLFEEISAFVRETYGNEIRIFSMPIAQCNDAFSQVIRNETKDPG